MEAEKQQASIAKEREKLQARMAKGQEQKERPAQEGAAERIDVVPVPDEQDDPAEDDPTQSGLYTCPDCGREISQLASSCPGCGRPSTVKEAQKIVLFVLLLILLLVFGGCVFKVVLTLA
jgi:rubrerythrin